MSVVGDKTGREEIDGGGGRDGGGASTSAEKEQGRRSLRSRSVSVVGSVADDASSMTTGVSGGSEGGRGGGQKRKRMVRQDPDGKWRNEEGDDTAGLEEGEWTVEKILRKFVDDDNVTWYRIKWLGWSSKYNSWEPVENLGNCTELLEAFELKELQRAEKAKKPAEEQKKKRARTTSPPPSDRETPPDVSAEPEVENEVRQSQEMLQNEEEVPPDRAPVVEEENPESEEDDKEERELERKFYGPNFRRLWRKEETPLVVVGAAMVNKILMYLVRLKPETEEEVQEVLKDPRSGLNGNNFVVTPSFTFKLRYPQIVIDYLQKHFVLT